MELCCVFAVLPRIPLVWAVAKANTNERPMLKRLVAKLRKGDLLLIDNGFYSFTLFGLLILRCCSFIIPVAKNTRPKIVKRLGDHDYLVEISDSARGSDATMLLRLVYVYRRGFRRRRILTNLLDPTKYPPMSSQTSTTCVGTSRPSIAISRKPCRRARGTAKPWTRFTRN